MKSIFATLVLAVIYNKVSADMTSCVTDIHSTMKTCMQNCGGPDVSHCFNEAEMATKIVCVGNEVCNPSASNNEGGSHHGGRGGKGHGGGNDATKKCRKDCHKAGKAPLEACINDPANNCASTGTNVRKLMHGAFRQCHGSDPVKMMEKCMCIKTANGETTDEATQSCEHRMQKFNSRNKRHIDDFMMEVLDDATME